MTTNGYIPFPRELFADGHWADEREYTKAEALFYLFAKAAYKAGRPIVGGKPVEVQPGQFPASVRYLMQAWKWSNSKVVNFLEELEKNDTIAVEKTTGQNIITVSFLAIYYADLTEKKTQKRQENDAEKTQKRQENDEIEESNKETKKEGKVETHVRASAPSPIVNRQSSIVTVNDPAFDLLKRIGKPAAQLWTQGNAADLFKTPNHADLALQWLEYICKKNRPLATQQELSAIVTQFNAYTPAELATLMDYSYQGGYTALYPDRLNRKSSTVNPKSNHRPEIIQKNRFTDLKADPSGLVKFD